MEVARLVGIQCRNYEKDGRQMQYVALHLMYPENADREVDGSKVEVVSCPRNVDPNSLVIGNLYQLCYVLFNTKNGKGARLDNLVPVDES